MGDSKPVRSRLNFGTTKEVIAVVVSLVSFLVSIASYYATSLKAPDLAFYPAPYIRHVVDGQSLNEAFFIPITLVNRGARAGTLVSVDLLVTYLPDGVQKRYYGQYFAQDNAQDLIGGYFTPINLPGNSSASNTVCFYPLGASAGNLFSRSGEYEFSLSGRLANVRNQGVQAITTTFRITVDDKMAAAMQAEPDGEYRFPIPVKN
jgi:hypothetical protein